MGGLAGDADERADAAREARRLIAAARDDLAAVRHRARGLADQTAWRCRAADRFRDALAAWIAQLDDSDTALSQWDGELADLQWRLHTIADGAG